MLYALHGVIVMVGTPHGFHPYGVDELVSLLPGKLNISWLQKALYAPSTPPARQLEYTIEVECVAHSKRG